MDIMKYDDFVNRLRTRTLECKNVLQEKDSKFRNWLVEQIGTLEANQTQLADQFTLNPYDFIYWKWDRIARLQVDLNICKAILQLIDEEDKQPYWAAKQIVNALMNSAHNHFRLLSYSSNPVSNHMENEYHKRVLDFYGGDSILNSPAIKFVNDYEKAFKLNGESE